jgi:hypothetical protein
MTDLLNQRHEIEFKRRKAGHIIVTGLVYVAQELAEKGRNTTLTLFTNPVL